VFSLFLRGFSMLSRPRFAACCLAICCLFAGPADAVITKLLPLKSVIDGSDHIFIANTESIEPARPSMTLSVVTDLKGNITARRLPVLLKGDSEGNPNHVIDRVKAGTPLILFVTEQGDQLLTVAFTEGTWFQLIGKTVDGATRWEYTHGEPYLRRTFKGTTEEMKSIINAYLKDMKAPPPAMPDEPAGFGPTLKGVAFEAYTPHATPAAVKDQPKTADAKDGAASTAPTATNPANTPTPTAPGNESTRKWLIIAAVLAVVAVGVLSVNKKKKA
jgi:hypothetical protein